MSKGHGDQAARWSLWDQPDIDLPCPSCMILADSWEFARFPLKKHSGSPSLTDYFQGKTTRSE
jgi:hypothetical protein